MKKLNLLFLSLFLIIPAGVMGQNFSNVKVNHLITGKQDTDGGNSIAVFENSVYVLWADYSSTFKSYISKSTDNGLTFGQGKEVASSGTQIFSAMTVDKSGGIYTTWCGLDDSGEMPKGIYFSKSVDGAQNFTDAVTISQAGFYPQIAVHNNYVYIFFFSQKSENNYGYFLSRSTDGGASFILPYEITDAAISSVKFEDMCNMVVDNAGVIYCSWNDGRKGTGSDIYFSKSVNNGESFSTNIPINTIASGSTVERCGASTAVYGSNVYVAWREGDWQNGRIMFSKSTDGGSSFLTEKEMLPRNMGAPSLAVNSVGDLYFAYSDNFSNQTGLFCMKSNDQGETFPASVFISDQNYEARYPSITVDANDVLYAAWRDERSGDEEIYFSKGAIQITGINDISSMPVEFSLMQNYPNPFNPTTIIRYELPNSCYVTLKVFDILGKEAAKIVDEFKVSGIHEIEFDGTGLSSGVYFYRLNAGDFSAVKKFVLLD